MVQPDPNANDWQTQDQIAALWQKISAGQYQFGNNDKPATIIKDYMSIYGRLPTPVEIQAALPAAEAGQGGAFIAQLYQNEQQSPEKVYAKQQEERAAKAPQFYDQINGMFQQSLGRDATDAEKSHFGSLLASGQVDSYQIGQFLQALPENVQKQDAEFRKNLTGELQTQDTQYYQEKILPAIQAQFSKQGRSVDSSGYANALALAAQQQNKERESYLANLSASQYAGRQGLTQDAYRQALSDYLGRRDYNTQRTRQLYDVSQRRANDLADFQMQRQAYDEYLRRYGKRSPNQAYGALAGGLLGLGIGAASKSPQGAMTGYQAGSGLGGGLGSFFE